MYQFKEEWKRQVYDILLMPIICDKSYNSIILENNTIKTPQTYCSKYTDADMSDFAIGFYEIIYESILKNNILNKEGQLIDSEFVGDTMNSFNIVANKTENAGTKSSLRTPISVWPDYLVDYYNTYHCLANFWLVPLVIGRTIEPLSKAKTSYDFMDRFLKVYKNRKKEYSEAFNRYFSSFKDFNHFAEVHFLLGSYLNPNIITFSYLPSTREVIEEIKSMMEKRAYNIAISKYSRPLWNYFNSLGLFKGQDL